MTWYTYFILGVVGFCSCTKSSVEIVLSSSGSLLSAAENDSELLEKCTQTSCYATCNDSQIEVSIRDTVYVLNRVVKFRSPTTPVLGNVTHRDQSTTSCPRRVPTPPLRYSLVGHISLAELLARDVRLARHKRIAATKVALFGLGVRGRLSGTGHQPR